MKIKANTTYYAKHTPSGEEWLLLGINQERNKVCVAGWPPTIAALSDCTDLEEASELTEKDLAYRNSKFGTDWN